MPPRLPLQSTLLYLLLCDYFSAPQWVWTLVVVFLVVIWIGCVHDLVVTKGKAIPGFGRKDGE
jgi:hypothetical protein